MLAKTQYSLFILIVSFLTACSTNIPKEISNSPATPISINDIQANPEKHTGNTVRWGGVIAQINNSNDATQLILIALPLDSQGRPIPGDNSEGRFVANIKGFLEPTVFNSERSLTISGQVSGIQTLKVGDFPYAHPVVEVSQFYLWPVILDDQDFEPYPYWWHDHWLFPHYPHPHPHRH